MKYIKYFELNPGRKYIELYSCDEFTISGDLDSNKSYHSRTTSTFAVTGLIDSVREDSKYLNDKKLRKIPISQKEINFFMDSLTLTSAKIINIEEYRSGEVGEFISNDHEELKKMIPGSVYMELTFKYYPILEDVIKSCKTYGELIDKYKEIKKNILKDLEYLIAAYKYNL